MKALLLHTLSHLVVYCCIWQCAASWQYSHGSTLSYLQDEPHKCSLCQLVATPAQTGSRSFRCSHHYWQGSNGRPHFSLCHSAGSSLRRRKARSPCCDYDSTRCTEHLFRLKGHSVRSPAGPNMWTCPPRSSRAKLWVWKLELTERKSFLFWDSVDNGC